MGRSASLRSRATSREDTGSRGRNFVWRFAAEVAPGAHQPDGGNGSLLTRLLYLLYERRLLRHVQLLKMPCHVAIILDGNRRHGRSRGLTEPREVYGLGAAKLDDVLGWCAELG